MLRTKNRGFVPSFGSMKTLASVAMTFLIFGVVSSADIVLKDNGYENVLVAISDNVAENDEIIKGIKSMFNAGSGYLYRATRHRAYFRNITILVPSKWTRKTEYESAANDEVVKNAALRVDKPNPEEGDTPYTRMYGPCGKQGLFIHLTPNYVINETYAIKHYGPPGKVLVHEWGHFRWGVADEYPKKTNYYVHEGTFHPTGCHSSISGIHRHNETGKSCTINPETKVPDKYCRFYPDVNQNETTASYMYAPHLKNVEDFCDDHNPLALTSGNRSENNPKNDDIIHNKRAPNDQNSRCDSKSAWEVIRETSDFKNGLYYALYERRNSPNANKNLKTTPTFRIVQRTNATNLVLLFDVSGSMKGLPNKIMRQEATNFIRQSIRTGSNVGVVYFNGTARTKLNMTRLLDKTDIERVVSNVPGQKDIGGSTAIGNGMMKAMSVLTDTFGTTKVRGARVILMTDGKDNEGSPLSTFLPYAKKYGISFYCIGYSQASDPVLESVARDTGGEYHFSTTSGTSSTLFNAFSAIADDMSNGATVAISASIHKVRDIIRGEFAIDFTIGERTTITFNYRQQSARLEVRLEGPDGTLITQNDKAYSLDPSTQVIQINIPGTATAGKWKYTITSLNTSTVVSVNVLSEPVDKGGIVEPIKVKSWFGGDNTLDSGQGAKVSLFVMVVRGYAPIVNLTVTAEIQGVKTAVIQLQDRGYGVDLVPGDGIYSAEFGRFLLNSQGRYSVTIRVDNPHNSAKIAKFFMVARAPSIGSGAEEPLKSYQTVGPLQRVASGGVLKVTSPSFSTLVDVTPPQKIRDLQLVLLDTDTFQVTLKWTAVGDDVSWSNATTYDLRLGAFEDITGNFQNCTHVSLPVVPMNAGEEERHTIDMSNYSKTKTHSLAVRVIDGAGNMGLASNVIFVAMVVPTKFSNGDKIKEVGDHEYYGTTIIIIAFGSILLFGTVLGLCIHYSRKRNKSQEATGQNGGQRNPPQNVYITPQQQYQITYDNNEFCYMP